MKASKWIKHLYKNLRLEYNPEAVQCPKNLGGSIKTGSVRYFIDSEVTLTFWVWICQKGLWFDILIESSERNLSRFFDMKKPRRKEYTEMRFDEF